MAKLYNLARMSTTTTGTGTITLGSAVGGYLTFAQAGVANGETIAYAIKDGANSEIGTGVYSSSGTTLTRSVSKSTNSDTAINLSGVAEVFITPRKEDLLSISETQSANQVLAGPSSGGAVAPTFRSLVSADLPAIAGRLVKYDFFTSTQSGYAIPTGATQALIRMCGGGGGAKSASAGCATPGAAAGGPGAFLQKLLTGLTAGNSLNFTVGAAGSTTPGNGGNTTVTSGTQTISTLAANGGALANGGSGASAFGAAGTASGGDLNLTMALSIFASSSITTIPGGFSGGVSNSSLASSHFTGTPTGFGGGGIVFISDATTNLTVAGSAGAIEVYWFS